jgi:hypothetical protein
MPAWTDRDILQIARRLAEMEPPPTPAMGSPLSLPETGNERPFRRRRIMRITITSGIAACVLAAAGLLLFTQNNRTASAAEQLQEAVEAGKAYKGWIHLTADSAGIKPPPGAPALPKRVTYHSRTVDGARANVREYEGGRDITIYWPATQEMVSYSAKTGEVHLSSLNDETVKVMQQNGMPATLGELLAMYKKQLGRDPVSVKETAEGVLKRFDITFFASDAEAEKFHKEHDSGFLGRQMSVWVNGDKLMTRMQFDDPSGKVTADISYGPPEIHDVYDLGAPRTAKVVDERLKDDLKGLMTRLDQRPIKGFGDYVALLAGYRQDDAGKVAADFGSVTLFAAKGDKWLANEYRLVATSRPRPENVLKELPPNWPAPDVAKLLPALFAGKATQYFIMDGDHGWAGWYQEGANPYPGARVITAKERNMLLSEIALASKFWPTSFNTGIGASGTTADLLRDAARPGLVGLHYKRVPIGQSGITYSSENTWWLDPARDDMPIETTLSSTETGQPKPESVTHTRYDKFAQLPNGQWYPTQWREDRTTRNSRTEKESSSTGYYRLQIVSTLKLDDNWFTDPRTRPTTAPAELP